MQADLDLNGNRILNAGTIDTANVTLNGQQLTDVSSVPLWRSSWSTGREYVKNDIVKEAGSSYICLVGHTSGTFSTDLVALRWELFAEKGSAGTGTGDMLGANNLSDVADPATARANLGVGQFPDGTAAAPSISNTGDTNTGVFFPAADTVAVATGGSERMRVDSSGNVGVGTTSPTANLHLSSAGTNATLKLSNSTSGSGSSDGYDLIMDGNDAYVWNRENGPLLFGTQNTERARITNDGNLLVGATSAFVSVSNGSTQIQRGGAGPQVFLRNGLASSGKFWQIGPDNSGNALIVYNQSGTGVYIADGGTGWTSSSDERLKTAVAPFEGAVQKVCSLRAGTGRYLTDEEDVSRSFLIAQDVQAVLPEAVDVQSDEQGTLGLRYTDVVPLLVAAIQEQQALITALTARVAALEA
jgi:hypothetical protein